MLRRYSHLIEQTKRDMSLSPLKYSKELLVSINNRNDDLSKAYKSNVSKTNFDAKKTRFRGAGFKTLN